MRKYPWLRSCILILIVLFIGYLHYVLQATYRIVFGDALTAVPVAEVQIDCPLAQQFCTKKYQFEISQENLAHKSLIVGNIFTFSSWYCGGKMFFSSGNSENAVADRTTHNEYFIIDSHSLSNCSSSRFFAEVSYPRAQKKSGLIEKELFLTSPTIAAKIKSSQEFVSKDYKIMNLCVMIFLTLFSFLIKIVTIDPESKLRLNLSLFLLAGALAQSCVLEVLFPFIWVIPMDRWIAAISYCSYLALGFEYVPGKTRGKAFYWCCFLFGIGVVLATSSRISAWIYFSFLASGAFIGFGVYLRSVKTLFFGLLTLTTSFDFVGMRNLPSSYIVPTFLGLIIFAENQKAFLLFLKISRLLKISRSKGSETQERKQHHFRTLAIIKLFQRQFQMGRITVLNLSDPEIIQLQQYTRSSYQPECWSTKELPPIFAHVVTTGNSLINVHNNSALVVSLRRNSEKHKTNSNYFTVLPIFAGKETIGAIALTEYDTHQFKSSLNYSTFLFCLDILKGLIVEHLLTTPKTESLNKISTLQQHINTYNFDSCKTLEELVDKFGGVLNRAFGWRVISATLPTPDYLLKVGSIYSFDPEIERKVTSGKLYAHEDNKQGPLALAVHEKKPVIVPNTKWLEGVVHPNTTSFFKIHSTKTAAFVPVLAHDEVVVGVYWIEGVKGSEISYSDRELFNSFVSTVSERIKLMKSDYKLQLSKNSLAQFLPKHLVEDYLAGKEIKEDDYGFLMMFDLKGSTRLSHTLGNAIFHLEVEVLKSRIESELKKTKWVLQQFVWDGFEFTYTSPEAKKEKINILQWKEILESVFLEWKKNLRHSQGEKPEIEAISYRLCFTYGDTSRGIVVEGATQKWTITGDAIAVASKIEQAAKHLPGEVFCDQSMLKCSNDKWTMLSTTNQGLIVYGLSEAIANQEKSVA